MSITPFCISGDPDRTCRSVVQRLAASIFVIFAACAMSLVPSSAQLADELPRFTALLPAARARALPVDPNKRYLVKQLKPGVFMITDGGYEVLFATTGIGVILFDAPPSMARYISQAISDTTDEPLVELVYSHIHVDHAAGAGLILREHPGIQILAEDGTSAFLKEQNDPDRPQPTTTFKGQEIHTLGTLTVELKVGHWHSSEGDLFIYLPQKRVLMAVDAFSANSVPFMGLDLTKDMNSYRKVFDQILAYDFDDMVPGQHSSPAERSDVRLAKDYVEDVYATAVRKVATDYGALLAEAKTKYGSDNTYPIARVLMDRQIDDCAAELSRRWADRLDNVDIWGPSHCRTALVHAEWDIGTR